MFSNYEFWSNAYKWGWADKALLKLVVKTETNPFGEITPAEYQQITGEEFEQ